MKNVRAKVGGEVGKNGEFYKGGQYLPSSQKTIKGKHKNSKRVSLPTALKKREIEAYVWEFQPTNTCVPIKDHFGNCADWNNLREHGVLTIITDMNLPFVRNFFEVDGGERYIHLAPYIKTERKYSLEELVALFNNGERWLDVETGVTYPKQS